MKKKIIILFLIFLLISGCEKNKENINETNSVLPSYNGSPTIIVANFSDIIEVENALESLSEEDFEKYMYNNKRVMFVNGMYDKESTEALLSEIYSTTFAFLDKNATNSPAIRFYREYNDISMLYELDENKRIRFISYTPENEANSERDMSKDENLVFEKEIQIDGETVKIFSFNNGTEGFRAQAKIDGTVISIWTSVNQPLEEFEKDLERFTFAKISDMVSPVTNTDAVPIS